MKNEDNPAFPQIIEMGDGSRIGYFGLTKLEAFTKEAMAGLLASCNPPGAIHEETIGVLSVKFAKATLAALEAEA